MYCFFFKAVVLLKARIHDKSTGDYSPKKLLCTYFCPSITQLQSYVIRLHKRDFPDKNILVLTVVKLWQLIYGNTFVLTTRYRVYNIMMANIVA